MADHADHPDHADDYEHGKMDMTEHTAMWSAFGKLTNYGLLAVTVLMVLMGMFLIDASIGGVLVFGLVLVLALIFMV